MKILTPVDGSPASLRAVKLAIELAAGRQQTTIVLLNVQNIPMLALTESVRAVMAVWLEEEEERASAEALREATRACEACLYRKLNSTIMLVEATHDRLRCDAAFVLDGTMDRCVFAKRPVSSQLVVVGSIFRQDPS